MPRSREPDGGILPAAPVVAAWLAGVPANSGRTGGERGNIPAVVLRRIHFPIPLLTPLPASPAPPLLPTNNYNTDTGLDFGCACLRVGRCSWLGLVDGGSVLPACFCLMCCEMVSGVCVAGEVAPVSQQN